MKQNDWNQGRHDAQQGKGPANQQNRPAPAREAYNAGYHWQQRQQGGKKQ
jgi:hypothetical protein